MVRHQLIKDIRHSIPLGLHSELTLKRLDFLNVRSIHLSLHVASNEVSDSQPVGLENEALNSPRTMLGIPIKSTHIFFKAYWPHFFRRCPNTNKINLTSKIKCQLR